MNKLLSIITAVSICGVAIAHETNNVSVINTKTNSPSIAGVYMTSLTNGLEVLTDLMNNDEGLSFCIELDVASRDVYQGFSPSDVSPSTMFFDVNLPYCVGFKGLGWMSNDDFDMVWWELSPYVSFDFDLFKFQSIYTYSVDCQDGRNGFYDNQYIDFNISMLNESKIPFYWAFNVEWDIDDENRNALYYDLLIGKAFPNLFNDEFGLDFYTRVGFANSIRNRVDYWEDEFAFRDFSFTVSVPWDLGSGVYCKPYVRYIELLDQDARHFARATSVGHHSWQVVGGVVVGMTF